MSDPAPSVLTAGGCRCTDELSEDAVLIDCDGCVMRDLACGDCVVTVLLGSPPGALEVDDGERQALGVLADSGLVPRLRLVPMGVPSSGAPADPASRSAAS